MVHNEAKTARSSAKSSSWESVGCCLPHDSVNGSQEADRRLGTPLLHTGLYGEPFSFPFLVSQLRLRTVTSSLTPQVESIHVLLCISPCWTAVLTVDMSMSST